MDGNGRWAKKHRLKRVKGHEKGADAVRATVRTCRELGVRYLTLYAFSVENWQRPANEIERLMSLLETYLNTELQEMLETGIRLLTIGDTEQFPVPVRDLLAKAIKESSGNGEMVLTLALGYGGRDEIVRAVRGILRDNTSSEISEETITKTLFSRYLYTADIPDPDLLIRTSGEYRLSNFLLWQMAYTELYFTDVLWPDFSKDTLIDAIVDYQQRERRFGLTSDQL